MRSLTFTAIEGMPLIDRGDNLAELLMSALDRVQLRIESGDIVVVCQKIVSKSEGRVYDLASIEPSQMAKNFAARYEKDARAVELVLRQTSRIVRMDKGVLIVETGPGWVC